MFGKFQGPVAQLRVCEILNLKVAGWNPTHSKSFFIQSLLFLISFGCVFVCEIKHFFPLLVTHYGVSSSYKVSMKVVKAFMLVVMWMIFFREKY